MANSTTSTQPPRRGQFSKKFKESKKVKNLLQHISNDNELDAQLRDGYINIYYNGGNILRIEQRAKEDFKPFLDKFYFYDDKETGVRVPKTYIEECLRETNPRPVEKRKENYPSEDYANLINNQLEQIRDEKLKYLDDEDYTRFFREVKVTIGPWIENKGRTERKNQHYISCSNRAFTNDNNLVVIDLEFAVSKLKPYNKATNTKGEKKVPKIDIIAVNREGQIYCIELKDKNESDKEDSPQNIKAHKKDFDDSVGNPCKENDFTVEMSEVLKQKQDFGLLGDDIFINTSLLPTFAIAFAGDKEGDIEEFYTKYRNKYPIIKIKKTDEEHLYLNI